MRFVVLTTSCLFISMSALADDFFASDGVSADVNALIHRLVSEAMVADTLVENDVNVEFGQGPMVCSQGATDDEENSNADQSPALGSSTPNASIVLDSANVCISR